MAMASPAGRRWLRTVVVAVVVALVAAVVTTVDPPGSGEASSAEEAFPLRVERPDLPHVADQDLTVAVGTEADDLPAGSDGSVRMDGTTGVTGMVRIEDEDGNLAGMALVPKDPVALLGTWEEGEPFDVPVDYRTTAFGLFASQPGVATTDPAITTVLAALAIDLPELDALAGELQTAAADDPAYLETLATPVSEALADLVEAVAAQAETATSELGDEGGDPGGETTTTQGLRGAPATPAGPSVPRAQSPADPDDCDDPPDEVLVLDPTRRDRVCLSEASFEGTAWEVHGTSSTPRWAVARPVNRDVPADHFALVPGKALAIPSLEGLAFDLTEALLSGAFDQLANVGINLCNAIIGLFGARCADPRPGLLERLGDMVQGYFADARVDMRLDGSEAQTVLSVNGMGGGGGDAPGQDVAGSWVTTMTMDVVIPAVGIFIDRRGHQIAGDDLTREIRVALVDMGATLYPDIVSFAERVRTGSALDRLGALVELAKRTLRAMVDSGYLLIVVREFFVGASVEAVVEQLRSLATKLATGPLNWINTGIDVVNASVTLLLLILDYGDTGSAVRYGLGYDTPPAPPDNPERPGGATEQPPLDNPTLPGDRCGLRVAVVLDHSGSISNAGEQAMADVRAAGAGLVDALGATPSSVRITAFANGPSTLIGWTSLAAPESRRQARQAAEGIDFTSGGDTNWQAALLDLIGQQADLAVIVTDGNPTVFGAGVEGQGGGGSSGSSGDYDPASLAAGVAAANTLKQTGTRVVAVGVGDVSVDPLRQISGPREGEDYYLGDFAALGRSLAEVAAELCGAGLIVRHTVGGSPVGGGEYTVDVPGVGPQSVVSEADGSARLSLAEPTDGVTVRGPAGDLLEEVACDVGGQPVDAEVDTAQRTVRLDLDGVVTCTFRWRRLTGDEAVLGDVLRRSGTVRVISFTPDPSLDGAIVGCLEAGRPTVVVESADAECTGVAFGVSFASGFAAIGMDEGCTSCPAPDDLTLSSVGGGVRFQVGRPAGSLGDLDPLDMNVIVRGPTGGEPRLDGEVAGSVDGDLSLTIDRARGSGTPTCLFRQDASGSYGGLMPDVTVVEGVGC